MSIKGKTSFALKKDISSKVTYLLSHEDKREQFLKHVAELKKRRKSELSEDQQNQIYIERNLDLA